MNLTDAEASVLNIREFCSFNAAENMLEFHSSPSPMNTASAAQVRLPSHTSSVNKWKNFERELQPLITTLERCTRSHIAYDCGEIRGSLLFFSLKPFIYGVFVYCPCRQTVCESLEKNSYNHSIGSSGALSTLYRCRPTRTSDSRRKSESSDPVRKSRSNWVDLTSTIVFGYLRR